MRRQALHAVPHRQDSRLRDVHVLGDDFQRGRDVQRLRGFHGSVSNRFFSASRAACIELASGEGKNSYC